jgi:TolB-like protein
MAEPANPDVVRRVAAVMVAERESGASSENAVALLRARGAQVEALPPDTLVAVFDEADEGLAAAMRLHRQDRARPAAWRVGLDAEELFLTGHDATGTEAIERATALARLARPGTTAIAAHALTSVGRRGDATYESIDDGRVHLVVPLPEADLRRRRALVLAGTGIAVGGLGGVAWFASRRSRGEGRSLTLAVGPFRSSAPDPARAWVGPALRDGLNAQLSEIDGIRVFSEEFIDFVMSREGLTPIDLANRLGIEKMVSGTVVIVGDTVRAEARIVDVATGLLEGAHVVSGKEADFFELERNLIFGLIAKLEIRLSPADTDRLAARRRIQLDAFKRLLDAEGESETTPAAPEEPGTGPAEPRSRWDLFGPRAAWADDGRKDIRAFLETYRRATEAADIEALGELYADFSPRQRAALERYFANVRDLRVAIDRVEIAVVGDEAVLTYMRTDDFIDVPSDRRQHVSIRVTKTLRRIDGRWRFAAR